MRLRALCIIAVAACRGPAYKISTPGTYEVGEDATVALEVRKGSSDPADLVVTRPDGSKVKKPVSLSTGRVKLGSPIIDKTSEVTFTQTGLYKIELRSSAHTLAAHQINISLDRLTTFFTTETIAGFAPTLRYARARQDGSARWMTYGAIYERTEGRETEIHVLIEDAGANTDSAWKTYEAEGTAGVLENANVLFRERTGSVSVSWRSGQRVISIRVQKQRDLEKAFVRFFFAKYPTK
jgi:hypothetical protein